MGEQLIKECPAKIYLVMFYLSLQLNIFFLCQHFFFLPPSRLDSTDSALSWTRYAAEEAEAVAAISCSGHGRAYVDCVVLDNKRPTCECNTCYTGADCSVLLMNCSADVASGDPLFLEPYWMLHESGSAVVLSGWHRMSYFTTDRLQSLELEKHVRLLHAAVGNANCSMPWSMRSRLRMQAQLPVWLLLLLIMWYWLL